MDKEEKLNENTDIYRLKGCWGFTRKNEELGGRKDGFSLCIYDEILLNLRMKQS